MCIGSCEFSAVAWFLRGYARALDDSATEDNDELDGFREWLHQRFGGPCNIDWAALMVVECGSGRAATESFFLLLDEFREDVGKRGMDAILRDHADYERRRYGATASSRVR